MMTVEHSGCVEEAHECLLPPCLLHYVQCATRCGDVVVECPHFVWVHVEHPLVADGSSSASVGDPISRNRNYLHAARFRNVTRHRIRSACLTLDNRIVVSERAQRLTHQHA